MILRVYDLGRLENGLNPAPDLKLSAALALIPELLQLCAVDGAVLPLVVRRAERVSTRRVRPRTRPRRAL